MSDEMFSEERIFQQIKEDKLINLQDRKKEQFIYTEEGGIKKLLSNLKLMLKQNDRLKDIGFNEFTQEITIDDQPITDNLFIELRLDISNRYYMDFSREDISQMVYSIARERPYHPIKAMIESEPWDGQKRVESLFIDFLGADDNEYVHQVTKKWLAGAVARIYQPGVKMELVPILQGKQGIGKSTLADKLGGAFFLDSLKSLGMSKDDYQLLIGAWIVELAELSSFNETKIETLKSFISARVDKVRLPYDKLVQAHKRTCVFIGTTNPGTYLRDTTGNRRFFPIPLQHTPSKSVHILDDETIQQIWAEAYQYYLKGEQLFLDQSIEELANEYRADATEENILFNKIDAYLEMPVPRHWNTMNAVHKLSYFDKYYQDDVQDGDSQIDKTTTEELAKVMKIDESDYPKIKQIGMYMESKEDWERKPVYMNGKTKRGYKRL